MEKRKVSEKKLLAWINSQNWIFAKTYAKTFPDIRERTFGYLPCVVLEKNLNQRIASTIRHNRARGKHSIAGMSGLVFKMLEGGWTDEEICNNIGLEPDELIRLKHITGFSKLFEDIEYKQAWEKISQIREKQKEENANG